MKIQDPSQPHQAMPSGNVTPRGGDDGTRTPGGKVVLPPPSPAARAAGVQDAPKTEPRNEAPDRLLREHGDTLVDDLLAEAGPLVDALKPLLEELRASFAPTFAQRLESLVHNATRSVASEDNLPDVKSLVGWCAQVLQEVDDLAKLNAQRVSKEEIERANAGATTL